VWGCLVLNDRLVGLLKQLLGDRRLQSDEEVEMTIRETCELKSETSTASEYVKGAGLEEMNQRTLRWSKREPEFSGVKDVSRSQWPRGLRRASAGTRLLGLRVRICSNMSVVSVVCCQVEVSATGWSLV
jgi:hypothetical protein